MKIENSTQLMEHIFSDEDIDDPEVPFLDDRPDIIFFLQKIEYIRVATVQTGRFGSTSSFHVEMLYIGMDSDYVFLS